MSRTLTYSLLVFVMILWGLNVVAVKLLVEEVPPILMQGVRVFLAGTILVVILFFLRDLRKMSSKEWLHVSLAAILGQVFHHGFLAVGLTQTTASNGSLILGLIPLTTAVLGVIFLQERLTKLRILGIILGFTGVSIVILTNSSGVSYISRGDLFVLISMISQAVSFILIKQLTFGMSAKQLTAVMLIVGSSFLIAISFIIEPGGVNQMSHAPLWLWSILIGSAILATGVGHILYNVAITNIGAGQSAMFNNLVPFIALVGSYLFLGEQIVFKQILGFVLIVLGVLLGTGYVEMKVLTSKNRQLRKSS